MQIRGDPDLEYGTEERGLKLKLLYAHFRENCLRKYMKITKE